MVPSALTWPLLCGSFQGGHLPSPVATSAGLSPHGNHSVTVTTCPSFLSFSPGLPTTGRAPDLGEGGDSGLGLGPGRLGASALLTALHSSQLGFGLGPYAWLRGARLSWCAEEWHSILAQGLGSCGLSRASSSLSQQGPAGDQQPGAPGAQVRGEVEHGAAPGAGGGGGPGERLL